MRIMVQHGHVWAGPGLFVSGHLVYTKKMHFLLVHDIVFFGGRGIWGRAGMGLLWLNAVSN